MTTMQPLKLSPGLPINTASLLQEEELLTRPSNLETSSQAKPSSHGTPTRKSATWPSANLWTSWSAPMGTPKTKWLSGTTPPTKKSPPWPATPQESSTWPWVPTAASPSQDQPTKPSVSGRSSPKLNTSTRSAVWKVASRLSVDVYYFVDLYLKVNRMVLYKKHTIMR